MNRGLGVALYHSEFAAVSALMEHRGVPIDREVFNQLADKKTWRSVRDAMVPTIDAKYGVYVRDAGGDWSFNMELFIAYLAREGITGWPLLESGKLNMRRKTFEEMSKGWPQLEELRQLRYARDKMRKVKLAVGQDVATAQCCGHSNRRRRAHNRKPPSGSSRRRCGCGR